MAKTAVEPLIRSIITKTVLEPLVLRPKYPLGMHIGTIINDLQKYYAEEPPTEQLPIVEFEFNGLIIRVQQK
jgi:kynurenine formamidase